LTGVEMPDLSKKVGTLLLYYSTIAEGYS
jgi:hypothetical protein